MRRTPFRPAFLAAAAVAVLLAGCGSSSGDDAADDPTTTVDTSSTTAADGTTTTAGDGSTTTEAVTSTTAGKPDSDGICEPLKALGASDAEANKLVAGGDWAKIQAFYVDQTDDITAIYDEAIGFDTEITPQLKTLRSVTVAAGDLAASSSSLMDFSGKLSAQPGLAESGRAALTANEFTQETCGFALAGF